VPSGEIGRLGGAHRGAGEQDTEQNLFHYRPHGIDRQNVRAGLRFVCGAAATLAGESVV
jgi:hypothetical protein